MHKKVKELAGTQKRRLPNVLTDVNGKIITETSEKLLVWEKYIKELFEDERLGNATEEQDMSKEQENHGPDITKEEVIHAIRNIKNGRSSGPDELPAEMLKLIEDQHLHILVNLFNTIYSTGIIPEDWLTSTFVTLPKKANAKQCTDHRTISLMSHTLKSFLKIIQHRIHRKLEQDISETQFGFRNGLGTREALFALNVLTQRCLDVNQDLHLCFIDYNKAFDKIRHDRLIQLLQEKKLDTRDTRIIANLYYNQKAVVQIDNTTSKKIEIRRGVRQGCVLSATLFNIYAEEIMRKALEDETVGVKVNGIAINNIRYADDTVLVATNLVDLQRLINKVTIASEEWGLSLNTKKTKYMVMTKTTQGNGSLYVHNEPIEEVMKFNYLGTTINQNNNSSMEIKSRIAKARTTFMRMRKALCGKDLSLELKARLTSCYVHSILLYGAETWTLKKEDVNRLEAFEMWTYRRILRIPWTDRVTNEEVIRGMGKEREIMNIIKARKLEYLGHIMRGEKYHLLQVIIQGKIQGKRSIGRRRHSWLKNLRDWFGCNTDGLFRAAVSKVSIAMMIANLRSGAGT